MEVYLHLGAHKTATTFIQASLAANVDQLRAADVGYTPLLQFSSQTANNLLTLVADRHGPEVAGRAVNGIADLLPKSS